jgi:signal transduction histidine kinase
MSRSLTLKWIATILATSLVGVGLVALFAYRATSNEYDRLRFDQYKDDLITTLTDYYQNQGSWSGIDTWQDQSAHPPQGQHGPPFMQHGPPQNPTFALADLQGKIVKPGGPFSVGQQVSSSVIEDGTPIEIDGQVVGTAILTGGPPELSGPEQGYLTRINTAVLLGTIGAIGVSLVVGTLLTRQIMQPLNELTTAIRAMKHGELEHRIPIRTRDELGELVNAFNQTSEELHRVNQLRRQMTADIAHELRTPLTVITGYLEGLRNGTLRPTPERLDILYGEAAQLGRLIEDLRTLSLADAGELKLRREPAQIEDILRQVAAAFEAAAQDKGVSVAVSVEHDLPAVDVDRERLRQVFTNLVSNALRYAPQSSRLTLSARRDGNWLDLRVQDQGPGIAADQLPNIFERFYRADASRSANGGESGLGLAIVRSIVEAHGGTVAAESQLGRGTTMIVRLPINRT